MHIKKYTGFIIGIVAGLLLTGTYIVSATTAVPWITVNNATTTPSKINGSELEVRGLYFVATSTTATSTLPRVEITDAIKFGEVILQRQDGTWQVFKASANTSAARGTALQSAKTAAVSGDLIVVGPGTYNTTDLAKDQVNYFFSASSTVAYTGASSVAIFDDNSNPMSFIVSGDGVLSSTKSFGNLILLSNSSSNAVFNFNSLISTGLLGTPINSSALSMRVNVTNQILSTQGSAITNSGAAGSTMYISAPSITGTSGLVTSSSGTTYIKAQSIIGTSLYGINAGANDTIFVDADSITGPTNSIINSGTGTTTVNANLLTGNVSANRSGGATPGATIVINKAQIDASTISCTNTTPSNKVYLNNVITLNATLDRNSTNCNIFVTGGRGSGTNGLFVDSGAQTSTYTDIRVQNNLKSVGTLNITAEGSSDYNINLTPAGAGNTIITAGNVGIGTSSPYSTLSVVGTTTAAVFEATSTATSTAKNGWNISTGCYAVAGTCISGGGSGITAIGPLNQAQTGPTITIASSTTGTDFTVTGSGNTLTWNLPTASASNRGLLSSTDWSTFNAKESALTFSTGLTRSVNTITNNLSVGVSGGQTAIGGTGIADALTFKATTGNGTAASTAFVFSSGNNGATNAATVLNNGKWGFGGFAPTANTQLIQIQSNSVTGLLSIVNSNTLTAASNFLFRSAGGTIASPTQTLAEKAIFVIGGAGYDADNGQFVTGAGIRMFADGNFSDGIAPMRIQFSTTGITDTTEVTRLILKAGGNVGVGTSTPAGILNITKSSGANASLVIDPGVAPTGPATTTGSHWYDSTRNALMFFFGGSSGATGGASGLAEAFSGNMYTAIATTTVNTAAETSLFNTATFLGTTTVPASWPVIGKSFYLHGRGQYSTPVGNVETVVGRVKYGATTIGTITTAAFPASATNQPFRFDIECTFRTVGASAKLVCDGELQYQTVLSGTNVWVTNDLSTIGEKIVDSTAKSNFDVTADWSATAFTTQSIQVTQAWIDIRN